MDGAEFEIVDFGGPGRGDPAGLRLVFHQGGETVSKKYDQTVAGIAGNLASGMESYKGSIEALAQVAVALARAIVAEVQRTEPAATPALCGNRVYTGQQGGTCVAPLGHSGKCVVTVLAVAP